LKDTLEVDKEKVRVCGALVHLVHEDMCDAGQRRVADQFTQQYPGGHEREAGAPGHAGVSADLIPHYIAHTLAALLRHAPRDGHGSHTAGLRHDDVSSAAPPGFRVLGLEFGVQGLGFKVSGFYGLRV
jgi:hypothetical protein